MIKSARAEAGFALKDAHAAALSLGLLVLCIEVGLLHHGSVVETVCYGIQIALAWCWLEAVRLPGPLRMTIVGFCGGQAAFALLLLGDSNAPW